MHQPKLHIKLLLFLLLTAAIIATYSNHFHNAFHFDDSHTIENNLFIRELSNIPRFFTDGTTFSSLPTNQSYRPLLTTSLAIDYALQGSINDTFWFHFTSFLFFLLQIFPMMILYRALLHGKIPANTAWFISLAAVAWYMLHPVNAETVNYLIQRGDSLSTFFVLCGFAIYLSWPSGKKYYLYLIPVAAGALTKPTAIMFAPLLMWYQWLEEENAGFISIWKKSRFLPLLRKSLIPLAACIALFVFTRSMEPESWTPGGSSGLKYMITQPYVFYHYFKMLI